jgi:hypothetical protein
MQIALDDMLSNDLQIGSPSTFSRFGCVVSRMLFLPLLHLQLLARSPSLHIWRYSIQDSLVSKL